MSNQILSQVKNLSLDEKREFSILLDELEEAKGPEKSVPTDFIWRLLKSLVCFYSWSPS